MTDRNSESLTARRWLLALVPVLLLAAALRLWSIDFGRGVERARPDEEFVSGRALEMLETGDPNPHFFHYPSLSIYVTAALLHLLPGVGSNASSARLLGRLVSVVCGVGTVGLVGFLGARLFSARAGLVAALFLSTAYLHVRESHFGTTDVPFTFLATASLALVVEARLRQRLLWLRLAAIAAGLATSTKYPGVLVLLPLAFVVASLEGIPWTRRVRELLIVSLLAFATLALTSPYLFLDPEGARGSLGELFRETWGDRALAARDPWYPITFSLAYGIGLPLLGLGGMGLAGMSRRWAGLLLLAWFVPYFAAAAFTPTRFARYALPLVPPLCLCAAAFLELLPLRRWLKPLIVLSAVVPSLLSSIAFDRLLGKEDTRTLASRWIERNLSFGTPVSVSQGYGAPSIPVGYPVRLVGARLAAVRRAEGEGFHHLVTHEHPALTRFPRVDEGLRARLDSAVLLARFDPFRRGVAENSPGIYDELDAFYLPFARFGGVERPGPIVSIWRLSP